MSTSTSGSRLSSSGLLVPKFQRQQQQHWQLLRLLFVVTATTMMLPKVAHAFRVGSVHTATRTTTPTPTTTMWRRAITSSSTSTSTSGGRWRSGGSHPMTSLSTSSNNLPPCTTLFPSNCQRAAVLNHPFAHSTSLFSSYSNDGAGDAGADDAGGDDSKSSESSKSNTDKDTSMLLKPGMKVLCEVIDFGPLGASVHVVAEGHAPEDLPPDDVEWPILATGLINQQELSYHRASRDNVDVVLGEILPAFVERTRDTDDLLGIALRPFGGRAKAQDLGAQIVQVLESSGGSFALGDKSTPYDIAAVFPGVSKSTFKKALSALFRREVIERPEANAIQLKKK